MTTRGLPVIAAHLVGIGFGLLGGYLLAAPRRCPIPAGRIFSVGAQTFVDGPFVEFLASRTKPDPQREWTLYRLREVGFFLKKFSDAPIFPRQAGSLYVLRDEPDRWNVDAEARAPDGADHPRHSGNGRTLAIMGRGTMENARGHTMNETQPQRMAQDRYQWRLYTVAAAGASFFAGMLVNNWIERRIHKTSPGRRSGDAGTER